MSQLKRQGELFDDFDHIYQSTSQAPQEVTLNKRSLENWQDAIHTHQARIFKGQLKNQMQGCLFSSGQQSAHNNLDPLKLTPLPLNFWRWPKNNHVGPAIYLVMDRLKSIDSNLILYIGETIAAEKRWKGEHDCKQYLDTYSQVFHKAGLETQLSIRFWTDVPKQTKARRQIEQELIQCWLPPFNKESRGRWATPFTNETNP